MKRGGNASGIHLVMWLLRNVVDGSWMGEWCWMPLPLPDPSPGLSVSGSNPPPPTGV